MHIRWIKIYALGLATAIGVAVIAERHWRMLGYHPTVIDDKALWSVERYRLDDRRDTLAVLGASRIQLGFDPDSFRQLYPQWHLVNLTVNGHYPLATLSDIATNTDFRGTLLISIDARSLLREFRPMQQAWVDYYRRDFGPGLWLQAQLASRFQLARVTANPEFSLVRRVVSWLDDGAPPHVTYVTFDRSRFGKADYRQVDAAYHLEHRVAGLRQFYEKFSLPSPELWLADTAPMLDDIKTIQERGGKVILLRMPTRGGYWDLDQQFLPRASYWDALARSPGLDTLHFEDVPAIEQFALPDGSHLDFRDRSAFTRALLCTLEMQGMGPAAQKAQAPPAPCLK